MEYTDHLHQELEKMDLSPTEPYNVKVLIDQAYGVGLTHNRPADPLAGYSNLTAAIGSREHIDWERMDGLKVQCVKSGAETLNGKMERDNMLPADFASGWRVYGMGLVYIAAWHGEDGWTLWVEGEIPLHRKTADQLDEGRCFLGKQGADFDPELMIVVGFTEDPKLNKIKPLGEHPGYLEPWQVEVLEEYGIGTFQKPEGK